MSKNTALDYEQLAQGVEQMREVVNSLVAGFVADGFTEEQARIIVVGMYAALTGLSTAGDDEEDEA